MTNYTNRVLYTGVTNNLVRRVWEHRQHLVAGFTDKYNVTKLVYYEISDSVESAIMREKQIKSGPRKKKIMLIKSINPTYRDLYDEIASPLARNDGKEV